MNVARPTLAPRIARSPAPCPETWPATWPAPWRATSRQVPGVHAPRPRAAGLPALLGLLALGLVALALPSRALRAAEAGAAPQVAPAAVARAFNAALSTRRLDGALALLAPGAVQFNLEAAHSFSAGAAPGGGARARAGAALTADLATHWRGVGPLLFSAHERYQREIVAETTHVDGSLAVVWARLRTTSKLRGSPATLSEFSETYLLHLGPEGWRIVGIANSRRTR